MLFTLGYGLASRRLNALHSFSKPFVVSDTPRITVAYDSNAQYVKNNASAVNGYNDQIELYFTAACGVQDFALSGTVLLKSVADASGGSNYLIDDDSGDDPSGWVRSSLYSTTLSGLTSDSSTSDIWVLTSGLNDANASGGVTKASYKQALAKLKEFVQADFVNVQAIIIDLVHRSAGGSPSDTNFQSVREAQLETIAEDDFFVRGIEFYDQAHRDTAHPTDVAFAGEIARRQAANIASIFKPGSVTGAVGPDVTAAAFETDSLVLTVLHDAGTDLTVTAGAEECFGLDVGGTVYRPSTVRRVDVSTLKLDFDGADFDAVSIGDVKVVYGAMAGLTQGSPEVVRDNASNAMPLRAKVLTPTQADPLIGMDFTLDLSAKLGAKTLSGSDVTAVTGRGSGLDFTAVSGREPRYDGARLNGAGALYAPDSSTTLKTSSGFTGSGETLLFVAGKCPASVVTNIYPVSFGNSSGGQLSLRTVLRVDAAGKLYWGQNQSSGWETLVNDIRGETFVLSMNFTSTSNCDFGYYSDAQVVTGSFDPRDNLSGQDYLWLFALNDSHTSAMDFELGRVWHRNLAHGAAGDADMATIVSYLRGHYGAEA